MKIKILITVILLVAGFIIFRSITGYKPLPENKPWPVPDKDKNMANPVKSDAASIADGKTLWAKHCQSCHGKSGMGDGSKAAQLKTEAGDFSLPATQTQSDGSLFYKSSVGRDDMPAFKKKIPDADDMWSIVNYIRTFKK